MYAERLGSYSIAATRACTPSLRRLKSTRRYARLAPPPRWRAVLRPCALRPPLFFRPSMSVFSGVDFVTSAKSGYETNRIPGLVGLGLRIGISALDRLQALEDRNSLARADLHDGLLPRARATLGRGAAALGFPLHAQRPHLDDMDVEQRLDRLAHVRLVRVGVHAEGVAVGRREHVALLGDDGTDEHLGVLHQAFSSPVDRGPAVRAVSNVSAGSDTSTDAAPSRSVTPTFSATSTATRAMFRKESAAADSSATSTTSVGLVWPVGGSQSSSRSNAWLVLGPLKADASRIAREPRWACSESALRSAARCSLRLTLNV